MVLSLFISSFMLTAIDFQKQIDLWSSRRALERRWTHEQRSALALERAASDLIELSQQGSPDALVIFGFGDHLSTSGWGCMPTPIQKLIRELVRQKQQVLIVQEAYTSRRCSHCGSDNEDGPKWAVRKHSHASYCFLTPSLAFTAEALPVLQYVVGSRRERRKKHAPAVDCHSAR